MIIFLLNTHYGKIFNQGNRTKISIKICFVA